MRRFVAFAILLALGLLPELSGAQTSTRYHWYYYVVDRNKTVGTFTTLVYDKNDLPNIAYFGGEGRHPAKFAHFDGKVWNITVVDAKGEGHGKMTFDQEGLPHLIYHTNDAIAIKHASYDGQKWTIRTMENTLSPGAASYHKSIQVDSNGRVHMCYSIPYVDTNSKNLTYAFFDSTGSVVQDRVDALGYNGKYNSLVLDEQKRPCLAYWKDGTSDLAFAFLDHGTWRLEMIEESSGAVDQGYYPSMQYDNRNKLFYISFFSRTSEKLRLARGSYGAWTVEDVTTSGTTEHTTPNPLALDQSTNPVIAFHDTQNGDLQIAYNSENVWHVETVDSIGVVGEYASLAITSEGMPAISYFDRTRGYLRLAVGSLTQPPDADQDGVPDYLELASGSDPADLDSDDDGLSDGEEDINHNGLVENYETDPQTSDTDGDGVLDGVERGRVSGIVPPAGMRGTDPSRFSGDADPSTQTNPLLADTDGDGLRDGEEDKNGNGQVDIDEPDPNNRDTDADDLVDGLEVQRGTSPLDIDSDDDGIEDNKEDKDLNGILDEGETDPAHADTDGDDLPDGLELGVTTPVADPDGPGKLLATDLSMFQQDIDPATTTDPRRADSDIDRLNDGAEDKNHNGRFDSGETDPLNADTDGDKLPDGFELLAGTNPLDLDSDDDGLADGSEDTNHTGSVDTNETSPKLFDSDGDGVGDGVESGTTAGIPDPDGNGPLSGTDRALFIPDADPRTNSNPQLWDTDEDGLSDGEEDSNHDGAVDSGETHFLIADTDADGLSDGDEQSFKSDPRNPSNKASVPLLLKDNFQAPSLQGWTVVDEGNIEAPSDWFTYNSTLVQTSNIWGGLGVPNGDDPHQPGTYIWANNFYGTNYKVTFKLHSSDNDELGVMFHYMDRQNYYRFSMNAEQRYRRLIKMVNGKASVITTQEFSYQLDRDYQIKFYAVEGRIQIYLDSRRIFDVNDSDLNAGSIAFYCWKNAGALFKELTIAGQGYITAVHDFITEGTIRHFALSAAYPNPASTNSTVVLQAPQPIFVQYRIFDLLGGTVRVGEKKQYPSGWHQIVWDGRDDNNKRVPTGIYFMRVIASTFSHSEHVVWNKIEKIVRMR